MVDILSLNNRVLADFAFYVVIVLGKTLGMGLLTSVIRISKGVYANPEDAVAFYKGKNPDKKKPRLNDEDVERARRNHLNDLENIPIFVLIGFLYVLTSPSPQVALWHFRIFGVSKLVHTFAYQMSLQPWRALFHVAGLAVTVSMGWQVLRAVISQQWEDYINKYIVVKQSIQAARHLVVAVYDLAGALPLFLPPLLVYANPEDAVAFYKGKNPDKKKPRLNDEDVERARRNHMNDLENIPIFVLIGFLYVLTSPSPQVALWHFRIFGVSKLVHTFAYQMSLQPWRALCHVAGLAVTVSMGWQVLRAVM